MHKPCKTENLHVDIQLNIVIAKTVTHFHKNQHIYIWFNYKRSVQIKKKKVLFQIGPSSVTGMQFTVNHFCTLNTI